MFRPPHLTLFILLIFSTLKSFSQCPINVTISSTPNLTTGPVCKGDTIQLAATPSIGAISPQYTWIIDSDTLTITDSTITIAAQGQTVQVIINTATGCISDIDSANITIPIVEITNTTAITNPTCIPPTADVTFTSSGGIPPYNYNLIGIGTNTTGIYNVVDNEITDCNQNTFNVELSTIGGSAPYTYNIQGIGQSDGFFSNIPSGDYTVFIIDDLGCMDTNTVSIIPIPCPDPSPLKAFTPNGDGANDNWLILNIELYPINEVSIFDRWGQRVYHEEGFTNNNPWDGKYLGVTLPVSTYFYVIEVKELESENKRSFKGPISIFK